MNKSVDENCSCDSKLKLSNNTRKTQFIIFNKPNTMTPLKNGISVKLKNNEISKIIKIDHTNNKNLGNNVKIEFNKDKSLVDKLFLIKNYMKIKKKTFI
jgi:hypothetical protein